jgi:hypothetical protein
MSQEIQPADPPLRKLAIVALLLAMVLGAVAMLVLRHWLADVRQQPASDALAWLLSAFAWVSGSACVLLFALGFYLRWVGGQVRAIGRYPLPGARLLRATPVLHEAAALRRAKVFRWIGALLMLCALALAIASWRVHSVLGTHAAGPSTGLVATR